MSEKFIVWPPHERFLQQFGTGGVLKNRYAADGPAMLFRIPESIASG
jgi:hypothetical protein